MGNNLLKRKKHQKIRAVREANARKLKRQKDKKKKSRYLSVLQQAKYTLPPGAKLSSDKLSPDMHRHLNYSDYQSVKAPINFSFLNNTLDTLHFIKKLENCPKTSSKDIRGIRECQVN